MADALNRKERDVPLRVRALVMTISLDLPKQILVAQIEALKPENLKKEDAGVDANHVGFVGLGMEHDFLSQKDSEVGRGVKEKQQADGSGYSSGNGGALSSGDATNTQLDVNVSGPTNVNGDSGACNLGNGGAPSSGDATNTQLPTANIAATDTPRNSTVNKEGNLHDENDGLTPSKFTSNPNKGILLVDRAGML
nr:putative reverse transcriptase domain-containing protein [Tanacetum cinerariifolium]